MFRKFLGSILDAPGVTWFSLALLVVLGCLSWRGLKVDLFPPLNFPTLTVVTEAPSLSSLQMERQVTLPIESAAGGVLGVTRVRSTSATGISQVSVDFQWGTDMAFARQLLMEALSSVRGQLPAEAEPAIETLSATLAMIEGYSLRASSSTEKDLARLRDSAIYDLKPRLQQVPGVYKVVIVGGRVSEYAVRPNPYLLVKYGLTLENLRDALAVNNIVVSPGTVNRFEQELVLHTNGQFDDAGEIADMVIAVQGGLPVRVSNVAKVEAAFQYERGDTSEDGDPSVLVNVYKQPAFDTGAVADGVDAQIAGYRGSLPQGWRIDNYYDQAKLVRDSLASVKESIEIGALFVVLVLWVFLRDLRLTLLAAAAIPISVLAAVLLMRAFGIGINIMSLGGLAIGTAVIVDDAVVVLENIFRWLGSPGLRRGRSAREAVLDATTEVVKPVVVSTATNIAIFAPMILIEGFAGRLFAPVSGAVTFSLVASLVVALTVIPLMSTRGLHGKAEVEAEEGNLHRWYGSLLRRALDRPKAALAAALLPAVLVGAIWSRLDMAFLPDLDEGSLLVNVDLPPGISLAASRRFALKIEHWAQGLPGVMTVVRRTGHAPGGEDTDNVNHSDIMIKLLPKNQRTMPLPTFESAMGAKTDPLASAQISFLMPLADKINDALGGVPQDIGVDLFGPDLDRLHGFADALVSKLGSVRGLSNTRPPKDIPVPSLEVTVDKNAAGKLGITQEAVQDALQAYSVGFPATSIRLAMKEIAVVLHYAPAGQNLDFEALKSLPLRTAGGSTVPLEQVARLRYGDIPSEINHDHLSRKITVTADISGRNAKEVAADIETVMAGLRLPAGYSWRFTGKYQAEEKAMSNMLFVLALAVAVVAFVLWIEFRSMIQVALVLLTLPLAAVGAVLGLWLFGQTLNVSSMAGAILLVGIVVKNGILLLDYMNRALAEGADLRAAAIDAARKRLRPILMTASVTMLGLLPLAFGWGTGSELQRPLAIAVVGGLLTSTILTLLVLPSAAIVFLRDASKN